MSILLALYKNIMNNVSNDPESSAAYTSQNLKKRLERHFGNNNVFFFVSKEQQQHQIWYSQEILT